MENHANFSCEFCSAKFTVKRNLLRHHRMFHQGQRILHVCDTCGKAFSRPDSLKRHMKVHQDSNEIKTDQEVQRPTCSQCKAQFIEQKQLDEHIKTHRLKETYLCHTCGRIYSQRDTFMKHIDSHHQLTSSKSSKKRTAKQPTDFGNNALYRRYN